MNARQKAKKYKKEIERYKWMLSQKPIDPTMIEIRPFVTTFPVRAEMLIDFRLAQTLEAQPDALDEYIRMHLTSEFEKYIRPQLKYSTTLTPMGLRIRSDMILGFREAEVKREAH